MKKINILEFCDNVVRFLNDTSDGLENATRKVKEIAELVTLTTLILSRKHNIQIDAALNVRDAILHPLAEQLADNIVQSLSEEA